MQRFIDAIYWRNDPLKIVGDDDCNHIHSSLTKISSREILLRLRRCSTENPIAYSEEKYIPLTRQTETWDCGLACLQMLLQWLKEDTVKDMDVISAGDVEVKDPLSMSPGLEKAWMIMFVATKSIWTIDLVMLLQHILTYNRIEPDDEDVDAMEGNGGGNCALESQQHCPCSPQFSYLFCSKTFGVDESYSDLGYYKDAFSSDELRVKDLFHLARKRKLPLLQTSGISLQTFADIISKRGVVAIVLLDNRILRSNAIHIASSYSGHYVLIYGISCDENDINDARMNSPDKNVTHDFCMAIKNPGSAENIQFIVPSLFEKAWRAKGTDEDVIFVAKHIL